MLIKLNLLQEECIEVISRYEAKNFLELKDEVSNLIYHLEKCWSKSWLGYHAEIYYENFKIPPSYASFDINHGLNVEAGVRTLTTGSWQQYKFDEVFNYILGKVQYGVIQELESIYSDGLVLFSDVSEEIIMIIDAISVPESDTFVRRKIESIRNISIQNQDELVNKAKPTKELDSNDVVARMQGLNTPPHIEIKYRFQSYYEPYLALKKLVKIIQSTIIHFESIKVYNERKSSIAKRSVFIGHGRSSEWRKLSVYLEEQHGLNWIEFEHSEIRGITVIQRLKDLLDKSVFALIVMTAEDEHMDSTLHARSNVIHEIGLFQGRLGFENVLVLIEKDCSNFSNINGLIHVEFTKNNIQEIFHRIEKALRREGVL